MKILSLFSGAGGMDLGFTNAGHKIIWANDNDPDCVMTYQKNLGKHISLYDIQKISPVDIPDADIIIGGFPCQGFSVANMKRFGKDERNSLYLQFIRVLDEKQPDYFIAENVKGILSLERGKAIKKIIISFKRVGYKAKLKLLNAADFGVPQNRQRVIIIGTRNDLSIDLEPSFPMPTHTRNPSESDKLKKWVTIGEALSGIPDPNDKHGLLNHVYSKYKVTNRNFTGHRRTDPNKPSPTILARGNGKGGVCAIPHPNNIRRLSVRESAIIQTFPNDFEFTGCLNSMYRQVGNAVPVLFAERIAKQFHYSSLGS